MKTINFLELSESDLESAYRKCWDYDRGYDLIPLALAVKRAERAYVESVILEATKRRSATHPGNVSAYGDRLQDANRRYAAESLKKIADKEESRQRSDVFETVATLDSLRLVAQTGKYEILDTEIQLPADSTSTDRYRAALLDNADSDLSGKIEREFAAQKIDRDLARREVRNHFGKGNHVLQENLTRVLTKAASVAHKDTGNVIRLVSQDGELHITAKNGDMTFHDRIGASDRLPYIDAVLEKKQLTDLVKRLPPEGLKLRQNGDSLTLKIMDQIHDFPIMPDARIFERLEYCDEVSHAPKVSLPLPVKLTTPPFGAIEDRNLESKLKTVIQGAATNDSRAVLNCVNFRWNPTSGCYAIAAADGYKLATDSLEVHIFDGMTPPDSFVLPAHALETMLKLAPRIGKGKKAVLETLYITDTPTQVVFSMGTVDYRDQSSWLSFPAFAINKYDGKFPAYESIKPTATPDAIHTVDLSDLARALRRVEIVAGRSAGVNLLTVEPTKHGTYTALQVSGSKQEIGRVDSNVGIMPSFTPNDRDCLEWRADVTMVLDTLDSFVNANLRDRHTKVNYRTGNVSQPTWDFGTVTLAWYKLPKMVSFTYGDKESLIMGRTEPTR